MEVLKTKDYTKFKLLCKNRRINRGHVKFLRNSIIEENLLSIQPIIVDKDSFIIDGQHRLEAAKQLDLPIYYTVQTKETSSNALYLLQQSKSWALNDYINFYTETKPGMNYNLFYHYRDKYGMGVDILSCIFSMYSISESAHGMYTTKKLIKKGLFHFEDIDIKSFEEDLDKYIEYRDFCSKRKINPKTIYLSGSASIAFCCFAGFYNPCWETFFSQLDEAWHILKPQYSYRYHIETFVKLYNYKKRSKILCLQEYENASAKPGFTVASETFKNSN